MQSGEKIIQYWDSQPATIDGVLGGYEYVHDQDVRTSYSMLEKA